MKTSILIVILSLAVIGCIIFAVYDIRHPIREQHKIVSMQRDKQISGHFYLGTGSINENTVYYCYEQQGNIYRLLTIPTKNCVILQTNERILNILPSI